MGTNGEELAQRETELLDPRTRSSRARLLQILSPDFIEVGASGETLRREDVIAALGRESPTRRWIEDLSIHTVATGVALVRCQAYRQLPG